MLGWVFAPTLVGRFTGRVLALPHRDWQGEYWHASRARIVPGTRTWTVVPAAEAGPYHRPPGERPLRAGWALLIVTVIPVVAAERQRLGLAWLVCLGLMMLASFVAYRVDGRRLARALEAGGPP
jgi:hypothetical protein